MHSYIYVEYSIVEIRKKNSKRHFFMTTLNLSKSNSRNNPVCRLPYTWLTPSVRQKISTLELSSGYSIRVQYIRAGHATIF